MKYLFQLTRFYLYSNLHIAICTVLLYVFSMESLRLDIDYYYLLILFFGTLIIYSIHRLVGVERVGDPLVSNRFLAYAQYKYINIAIALVSVVIAIYAFLHLSKSYYLGLGMASLLSIAYSLPIFPEDKRLRDYNYIKVFLIALVWSGLSITIPFHVNEVDVGMNLGLSIERCLYILAITIPFDIRDFSIDKEQQVETLPSLLGKDKSKMIALILMGLAGIMSLVNHWGCELSYRYLIPILSSYILSFILVFNASEKKHDYYYTGLLDGTMMLPFGFLLLIEQLG